MAEEAESSKRNTSNAVDPQASEFLTEILEDYKKSNSKNNYL
jgi:hypothetical protein